MILYLLKNTLGAILFLFTCGGAEGATNKGVSPQINPALLHIQDIFSGSCKLWHNLTEPLVFCSWRQWANYCKFFETTVGVAWLDLQQQAEKKEREGSVFQRGALKSVYIEVKSDKLFWMRQTMGTTNCWLFFLFSLLGTCCFYAVRSLPIGKLFGIVCHLHKTSNNINYFHCMDKLYLTWPVIGLNISWN